MITCVCLADGCVEPDIPPGYAATLRASCAVHGLDAWCRVFERVFIEAGVRLSSREPQLIRRDKRTARRLNLPLEEETLSYSWSWKRPFDAAAISIEVSYYWEQGWEPVGFAQYLLRRHGPPMRAEGRLP